jgi:hypothetical protein
LQRRLPAALQIFGLRQSGYVTQFETEPASRWLKIGEAAWRNRMQFGSGVVFNLLVKYEAMLEMLP